MTPTELRELLQKHGISQRGAARQLGIDERTMRRYVAGDRPIPRVVELAVHYIIEVQGPRPDGNATPGPRPGAER